MTHQTQPADRRERYATAIHDAMEPDLSLVDQEPAYQALIARAAEAAEALADAEQNRQFLTTLANLGIANHRLDRIRDAARLHRQQLLGTSELYAVIEADDAPEPAAVSAAVAPPTNRAAAPTVWVDGHPQLEAIAAAVWEQCRTEGTSLVVDDPRNIAVAALAALRRMADETATETPARTPCSVPECDADGTGEPCTRHEREDAHAEGNHELCGAECEPAAGARQDETTALNLLPLLASPEPCHWDGPVCTAHLWRSDIGRCPHAQAQALLGGEPR